MVRTPGEIFSYMQSNKIGEKVAVFWIGWAFVAEKAENFKLADQIFQKGLRRKTEPKTLLQSRYQQFQRRMARHFISRAEGGELNIQEDETVSKPPTRAALQSISQAQADGVLRIPNDENSASTGRTTGGINQAQQRQHSKPKSKSSSHQSNSEQQFPIFTDNAPNETRSDSLPVNPHWKSVPKETVIRKENEGIYSQIFQSVCCGCYKMTTLKLRQVP